MLRKSQFAMEFISLFVVAFFVFLIVLAYAGRYTDQTSQDAEKKKLDMVGEKIKKEVILAKQSASEFKSSISIPADIEGMPIQVYIDYNTSSNLGNVLMINYTDKEISIIKHIPDVNITAVTNPLVGCKTIEKISTGELRLGNC